MIGGKAHAYPVIDIGRHIVTNIDIVETANIHAIDAWVASSDMMRVNSASLAEIMFGDRRVPLIKAQ